MSTAMTKITGTIIQKTPLRSQQRSGDCRQRPYGRDVALHACSLRWGVEITDDLDRR